MPVLTMSEFLEKRKEQEMSKGRVRIRADGSHEDVSDNKVKMELCVPGHNMDPLLWNLLHHGYHHPYEDKIVSIIMEFLKPYGILQEHVIVDEKGNLVIEISNADGSSSPIIFMSHMDTVHHNKELVYPHIVVDAPNKDDIGNVYGASLQRYVYYKDLATGDILISSDLYKIAAEFYSVKNVRDVEFDLRIVDEENGKVQMFVGPPLGKKENRRACDFYCAYTQGREIYTPSVLGADDKLGVWIMCQLLAKKTPGLYIFHVGEEIGCIGSKFIVSKKPEYIENRQFAIAFDRKGYTDVIAHQSPGRCASKEFTKQLADMLNEQTGIRQVNSRYEGDVRGVFTDSASYQAIIPECTNISVGYFNQHGSGEFFDYVFLTTILMPALHRLDWTQLKAVRKPGDVERTVATHSYGGYGHNSTYNDYDRYGYEYGEDGWMSSDIAGVTPKSTKTSTGAYRMRNYAKFSAAMMEDKFWLDFGVVPPWKVDKNTPVHLLPPWLPHVCHYPGTTQLAMRRIIHAHLMRVKDGTKINSVTNIICDMSATITELEARIVELISAAEPK